MHGKTSAWLTVLPLLSYHFDLSATEFCGALSMRYLQPVMDVVVSMPWAANIKRGLVTQRHNEVRDAPGDLASMKFNVARHTSLSACAVARCAATVEPFAAATQICLLKEQAI